MQADTIIRSYSDLITVRVRNARLSTPPDILVKRPLKYLVCRMCNDAVSSSEITYRQYGPLPSGRGFYRVLLSLSPRSAGNLSHNSQNIWTYMKEPNPIPSTEC